MRSKDFVSVFLLRQLLVTASRSGKEKEMNRKDVKKLLLAVIAVVIVAKIARDIMKARKQKENIPADIFEDFYEEEMNWWDKDLEEGFAVFKKRLCTDTAELSAHKRCM